MNTEQIQIHDTSRWCSHDPRSGCPHSSLLLTCWYETPSNTLLSFYFWSVFMKNFTMLNCSDHFQGGAIRPKKTVAATDAIWGQQLTPRIHFETTVVSLHYETKRKGHFLTFALKPLWFQNESDSSIFSCCKATKKWPDGATCVFLST